MRVMLWWLVAAVWVGVLWVALLWWRSRRFPALPQDDDPRTRVPHDIRAAFDRARKDGRAIGPDYEINHSGRGRQ